SSLENARAYV
nr:Chain C, 10-mer peptide from Polymerase acidic protein [synthetic construct]